MVFTLINANVDNQALDMKLSELIYALESKDIILRNIQLKHIRTIEACEEVHQLVESSDFVIYVAPLDSEASIKRLELFQSSYQEESHPPLFLILDSNHLLSVDDVTSYIETFEQFASNHKSHIVDVQYFKDAIETFNKLKI